MKAYEGGEVVRTYPLKARGRTTTPTRPNQHAFAKMAGHFTVVDPDQCEYYARFINHLTRRQADVIFWGNFCLTIILLIIASQMYTK